MQLSVQFKKNVPLKSNQTQAFLYLSKLTDQVSIHFPGVREIKSAGPDVLHWQFKKIEVKGMGIDVECFTRSRIESNLITVTPIPDKGNSKLLASWKLIDSGNDRSSLEFEANFSLDMNIPFWLSKIALPFAQTELSKLFDRYLQNVEKAL